MGKEDRELIEVHKALTGIRKKYSALKTGSLKFLYGQYHIISYGRWDESEQFCVIVNNNSEEKQIKVPVWQIGITDLDTMEQIIETDRNNFSLEERIHFVYHGKVLIKLKPFSAVILKKKIY